MMKMVDAEDLLIEILVRLPPISVLRFQCVSKQWLSIISSLRFRRLHSRRSAAVVTALLFPPALPLQILLPSGPQFVALPNAKRQHFIIASRLIEACDGRFVASLHSCNGLVCIGLSDEENNVLFPKIEYYVYNPTTNQRTPIPQLRTGTNIAIAFDPSKSNHYNLVCVSKNNNNNNSRFWVFSSESRIWRNTGLLAPNPYFILHCSFSPYLNGAIHWYVSNNEFVCFDIDTCRLRPMPCISFVNKNYVGECKYLGECGGHLHFIAAGGLGKQLLDVFEMENDYSRWVFKYQVDVGYVARFYPTVWNRCNFFVHLLLTGKAEEGEGLVISLPDYNTVIFLRLHDMSITQLHENCVIKRNYFASTHIDTLAFVEPGI